MEFDFRVHHNYESNFHSPNKNKTVDDLRALTIFLKGPWMKFVCYNNKKAFLKVHYSWMFMARDIENAAGYMRLILKHSRHAFCHQIGFAFKFRRSNYNRIIDTKGCIYIPLVQFGCSLVFFATHLAVRNISDELERNGGVQKKEKFLAKGAVREEGITLQQVVTAVSPRLTHAQLSSVREGFLSQTLSSSSTSPVLGFFIFGWNGRTMCHRVASVSKVARCVNFL